MGLIEEGNVSGTLPSEQMFSVHYPGYPSSTPRAITTLGGTEGILKVRSSHLNKLELRFRPEDPYSHPAFGELRPCTGMLLKISRKKPTDSKISEVSNKTGVTSGSDQRRSSLSEIESVVEEGLCADIVARVNEAYTFDGMFDYQHVLPVHAEVARGKKRNWLEVEEEPLTEKGGLMDFDQEDVMMLLPPLFSPKDIPENLVLRPPAALSTQKKQEVVQKSYETDVVPGLAVDYNVKEVPSKVNWEEFLVSGSEQWNWQMIISKLFDERPIWPKESLTQRLLEKDLKFSHQLLVRLLLRVAYYFSSGPFIRFWIRKGYDPRKDPESRVYQKTDFRVPIELRSYCDAYAANRLEQRHDDLCSFRVFPYKCQTIYQLFELNDDFIQQEIIKTPKQTTCDWKTGWFSECMLDTLRLRVAVRFLSIYPKTGAESILKATKDDFEKSKKMLIYKDILRPSQMEQQQKDTGLKGKEEKEKLKSVNENQIEGDEDEIDDDEDEDESEDDEDEIEAEEDEDEVDEYEELNMAGDENDMGTHSQSYLDMENNSKMYLQELFDTFPATEGHVDKIQDADSSGEEYQVYEQDTDGDNSGDDDDNVSDENDDD